MTEYFSVQNNKRTLRGTLHLGNNHVPVLIVHGYFSSNKIGPYRLYVEMANYLAEAGYSVLRIDLSGMGESDGNIEDLDFSDHVSDVDVTAIKLMEYCGSNTIHLIGHCIGTCTIIQSALNNSEIVASMTLISPFMPSRENYIRLLLSESNYQELQSTGKTLRNGFICRKSFIDAGYVINRYQTIDSQGKFNSYMYFAKNDEMVDIDEIEQWAETNKFRHTTLPHADHNYTFPTSRKELFTELGNRLSLLNSTSKISRFEL